MQLFPPKFQGWLRTFLVEVHADGGMVHVLTQGKLNLVASLDIPLRVSRVVDRVAVGEGLWGRAAESARVIPAPDLTSGEVAGRAAGACAVPVLDPSGEVRGVVTLIFDPPLDLGVEECAEFMEEAASLPPI